MNVSRVWLRPALTLSVAGMLVLAACSSTGGESPAATSGDGGVEGFVSIHGSSTVAPISQNITERFADLNPGFDFEVGGEGEGTGAGFQDFFCTGDSDISDASRQIREEEVAQCEEAGVNYVELLIAYDGLSVITSVNNDIDCLSFLDLYALIGPESEGFDSWSDANDLAAELEALAAELEGTEDAPAFGESHAPYPDVALTVAGPSDRSGTFDTFNEFVIADIGAARGIEDAVVRPDYSGSEADNDIVNGIGGSDTSLGWVGQHFASENADVIKSIGVDGGDGCVQPSLDTVADGSYPISRPLYIYVNAEKAGSNAALAPFVDYFLSDDGLAAVEEEGYVPLPEETLAETRATWEGR